MDLPFVVNHGPHMNFTSVQQLLKKSKVRLDFREYYFWTCRLKAINNFFRYLKQILDNIYETKNIWLSNRIKFTCKQKLFEEFELNTQ